jgi:hypothetical protein
VNVEQQAIFWFFLLLAACEQWFILPHWRSYACYQRLLLRLYANIFAIMLDVMARFTGASAADV